jgi:hypothetical protein
MRPNTLKLSLVLALSLATLAACDKHGKDAAAPVTTNAAVAPAPAAPAMTTTTTPTVPTTGTEAAGGKKAWKLACADDLKKFCADADKPGRCLKQHQSEISEGCKTARAEARAAHKAAMEEKAQ